MRTYFRNAKQIREYPKDTKQALKELGLDWTVEKIPNHCYFEHELVKSNSFSIVRTDTKKSIGTVGSRYQPIQNTDALSSFVDALIGAANGEIINGGQYDSGSQVYLTVKLNKSLILGGEDLLEYYLQAYTSHDGSSSLLLRVMALRQICTNGMMGLVSQGEFRIRHSQNAHLNIAVARKKLDIVYSQLDEFKSIAEKLTEIQITAQIATKYFSRVFEYDLEKLNTRQEDRLDSLAHGFLYGQGAELKTAKGTAWGAYQAVIEHLDYGQGNRDVTKSNAVGNGYLTKVRALELVKEIAA